MNQLLGQYKVQVYHKGRPAEQFDMFVDPQGNVVINGPQWDGCGVLWRALSEAPMSYNGMATLHHHDGAIAYHAGWVDDQGIFHVKAIFPGGSVTLYLEWRLAQAISEDCP